MELCLLLEAQGNAVAPVPLWATLVLGALPITPLRLRGPARPLAARHRVGQVFLTAALTGSGTSPTATPPVCHGGRVGDGWVLAGTELAVPQAHLADADLVPGPRPTDGASLSRWSTRRRRV